MTTWLWLFLNCACAGALLAGRFAAGSAASPPQTILLAALAMAAWLAGFRGERLLPASLRSRPPAMMLLTVSLLLLMASGTPRLDLFNPLTMKVMKFVHDFVHQFFESMLIPDHPFFRSDVWEYIGLLFGDEVGFWGGLLLWFFPAFAVLSSIGRERLPSVAHLRQGARRRTLLARYRFERRCRLLLPALAMLFLAVAVYGSRFPSVEYWDPKPVEVTAGPAGDILIPLRSGDVDLGDGRLHKFAYKRGGATVRFFLLRKGDGQIAGCFDACAICRPEGYGQGEGNLICYYCKTLIPLDTVGKPGGCNPVPFPLTRLADGVKIPAATLLQLWGESVQQGKKVPGPGGRE